MFIRSLSCSIGEETIYIDSESNATPSIWYIFLSYSFYQKKLLFSCNLLFLLIITFYLRSPTSEYFLLSSSQLSTSFSSIIKYNFLKFWINYKLQSFVSLIHDDTNKLSLFRHEIIFKKFPDLLLPSHRDLTFPPKKYFNLIIFPAFI